MGIFLGGREVGGSGGGGFVLGPLENEFTSIADRDTYATNNAAWLTEYDRNKAFLAQVTVGGTASYYRRNNSAWEDVAGIIGLLASQADIDAAVAAAVATAVIDFQTATQITTEINAAITAGVAGLQTAAQVHLAITAAISGLQNASEVQALIDASIAAIATGAAIDARSGLPAIATDGSEDESIAVTNDGLYSVHITTIPSIPPTGTWTDYTSSIYLGAFATPPTPPQAVAVYYDTTNDRWQAVHVNFGVYYWGAGGTPTGWIGSFANEDEALNSASANGEIAYTGTTVQVLSNYVAPTSVAYLRNWQHAGISGPGGTDEHVTAGQVTGTNIVLDLVSGTQILVDVSGLGGGISDGVVQSGTLNTTTGFLTLDTGLGGNVTIDLSAFLGGGTMDGVVTSGSLNGATGIMTLDTGVGGDVLIDLSTFLQSAPVAGVPIYNVAESDITATADLITLDITGITAYDENLIVSFQIPPSIAAYNANVSLRINTLDAYQMVKNSDLLGFGAGELEPEIWILAKYNPTGVATWVTTIQSDYSTVFVHASRVAQTGNDITLTPNFPIGGSSSVAFKFVPQSTNTGNIMLEVVGSGLPQASLRTQSGAEYAAGALPVGLLLAVIYDTDNAFWYTVNYNGIPSSVDTTVYKGVYDSSVTYATGDEVLATTGDFYKSRVDSNTGNTPQSSATEWSNIVAGTTDLSIGNQGAVSLDIESNTGTDATVPSATNAAAGLMSASDKASLEGFLAGGTGTDSRGDRILYTATALPTAAQATVYAALSFTLDGTPTGFNLVGTVGFGFNPLPADSPSNEVIGFWAVLRHTESGVDTEVGNTFIPWGSVGVSTIATGQSLHALMDSVIPSGETEAGFAILSLFVGGANSGVGEIFGVLQGGGRVMRDNLFVDLYYAVSGGTATTTASTDTFKVLPGDVAVVNDDYVLTVSDLDAIPTLTDGMEFQFFSEEANEGAVTIQINGTTAISTVTQHGDALGREDFGASTYVRAVYDEPNTQFVTDIVDNAHKYDVAPANVTVNNVNQWILTVPELSLANNTPTYAEYRFFAPQDSVDNQYAVINSVNSTTQFLLHTNGSRLSTGDISSGDYVIMVRNPTGLFITNFDAVGGGGGGLVYPVAPTEVGGSADSIELTVADLDATPTLIAGMEFQFYAEGSNTGAITIQINSGGSAITAIKEDGAGFQSNQLRQSSFVRAVYDGPQFVTNLGVDGTTNLSVVNRNATHLTVASDTGSDAIIPPATTSEAGLMNAADKIAVTARAGRVTWVANTATEIDVIVYDSMAEADFQCIIADDGTGQPPHDNVNFRGLNSTGLIEIDIASLLGATLAFSQQVNSVSTPYYLPMSHARINDFLSISGNVATVESDTFVLSWTALAIYSFQYNNVGFGETTGTVYWEIHDPDADTTIELINSGEFTALMNGIGSRSASNTTSLPATTFNRGDRFGLRVRWAPSSGHANLAIGKAPSQSNIAMQFDAFIGLNIIPQMNIEDGLLGTNRPDGTREEDLAIDDGMPQGGLAEYIDESVHARYRIYRRFLTEHDVVEPTGGVYSLNNSGVWGFFQPQGWTQDLTALVPGGVHVRVDVSARRGTNYSGTIQVGTITYQQSEVVTNHEEVTFNELAAFTARRGGFIPLNIANFTFFVGYHAGRSLNGQASVDLCNVVYYDVVNDTYFDDTGTQIVTAGALTADFAPAWTGNPAKIRVEVSAAGGMITVTGEDRGGNTLTETLDFTTETDLTTANYYRSNVDPTLSPSGFTTETADVYLVRPLNETYQSNEKGVIDHNALYERLLELRLGKPTATGDIQVLVTSLLGQPFGGHDGRAMNAVHYGRYALLAVSTSDFNAYWEKVGPDGSPWIVNVSDDEYRYTSNDGGNNWVVFCEAQLNNTAGIIGLSDDNGYPRMSIRDTGWSTNTQNTDFPNHIVYDLKEYFTAFFKAANDENYEAGINSNRDRRFANNGNTHGFSGVRFDLINASIGTFIFSEGFPLPAQDDFMANVHGNRYDTALLAGQLYNVQPETSTGRSEDDLLALLTGDFVDVGSAAPSNSDTNALVDQVYIRTSNPIEVHTSDAGQTVWIQQTLPGGASALMFDSGTTDPPNGSGDTSISQFFVQTAASTLWVSASGSDDYVHIVVQRTEAQLQALLNADFVDTGSTTPDDVNALNGLDQVYVRTTDPIEIYTSDSTETVWTQGNIGGGGVLAWIDSTTYAIGDLALYNEELWLALGVNTNSGPTSTNPDWKQLSDNTAYNFDQVTVSGDDPVTDSGDVLHDQIYVADETRAGNAAFTAVYSSVIGSDDWIEVARFYGRRVRNWVANTQYYGGELVIDQNKIYIATNDYVGDLIPQINAHNFVVIETSILTGNEFSIEDVNVHFACVGSSALSANSYVATISKPGETDLPSYITSPVRGTIRVTEPTVCMFPPVSSGTFGFDLRNYDVNDVSIAAGVYTISVRESTNSTYQVWMTSEPITIVAGATGRVSFISVLGTELSLEANETLEIEPTATLTVATLHSIPTQDTQFDFAVDITQDQSDRLSMDDFGRLFIASDKLNRKSEFADINGLLGPYNDYNLPPWEPGAWREQQVVTFAFQPYIAIDEIVETDGDPVTATDKWQPLYTPSPRQGNKLFNPIRYYGRIYGTTEAVTSGDIKPATSDPYDAVDIAYVGKYVEVRCNRPIVELTINPFTSSITAKNHTASDISLTQVQLFGDIVRSGFTAPETGTQQSIDYPVFGATTLPARNPNQAHSGQLQIDFEHLTTDTAVIFTDLEAGDTVRIYFVTDPVASSDLDFNISAFIVTFNVEGEVDHQAGGRVKIYTEDARDATGLWMSLMQTEVDGFDNIKLSYEDTIAGDKYQETHEIDMVGVRSQARHHSTVATLPNFFRVRAGLEMHAIYSIPHRTFAFYDDNQTHEFPTGELTYVNGLNPVGGRNQYKTFVGGCHYHTDGHLYILGNDNNAVFTVDIGTGRITYVSYAHTSIWGDYRDYSGMSFHETDNAFLVMAYDQGTSMYEVFQISAANYHFVTRWGTGSGVKLTGLAKQPDADTWYTLAVDTSETRLVSINDTGARSDVDVCDVNIRDCALYFQESPAGGTNYELIALTHGTNIMYEINFSQPSIAVTRKGTFTDFGLNSSNISMTGATGAGVHHAYVIDSVGNRLYRVDLPSQGSRRIRDAYLV